MSISPQEGTVEDTFELKVSLTGENASKILSPTFENSDSFQISQIGTSSRSSIINGVSSLEYIFFYRVTPAATLKPGKYPLPLGMLKINAQQYPLKQVYLTITDKNTPKNVQGTTKQTKSGVDFVQLLSNQEPYVGEQLIYRAELVSSVSMVEASLEQPDFGGFLREDLGEKGESKRRIGNSNVFVYSSKEVLFPSKAGSLTVSPRSLRAKLQIQRPSRMPNSFDDLLNKDMWGGLFPDVTNFFDPNFDIIEKRFVADAVAVKVRELPPAPFALPKYVPVGKLSIRSQVDKKELKEGENVSFEITLEGDANLRPLELDLTKLLSPNDFKIYTDKPELKTEFIHDRLKFIKQFRFALVPTHPGALEIPKVKIPYFDPTARSNTEGDYKTLETVGEILKVAPDPNKKYEPTPLPNTTNQANPAAPNAQPDKSTVDDLLPQHQGAELELADPDKPISDTLYLLILILPPLLVLWRFFERRRAEDLHSTSAEKLRQKAEQKAFNALANDHLEALSGKEFYSSLNLIFRNFISERFGLRVDGLTVRQIEDKLSEKINDPVLKESAGKILRQCENNLYRADVVTEQKQDLLVSMKETIRSLNSLSVVLILTLVLFFSKNCAVAVETDSYQLLQAGDNFYRAGDYLQAIDSYRKAEQAGVKNGDFYYNLANAYFRSGAIGRSIAYYRQALRFIPADPDLKGNLSFARKHVAEAFRITTDNPISTDIYFPLLSMLSKSQLLKLFIVSYLIFWGYLGLATKTRILPSIILALISAYLFVSSSLVHINSAGEVIFNYLSESQAIGVIVSDQTKVYAGDGENFQLMLKIPEGAELDVGEIRDGWVQVFLPAARKGWIKASNIQIIN
jgi:tetratricopeptide (TPR) repeat protein